MIKNNFSDIVTLEQVIDKSLLYIHKINGI